MLLACLDAGGVSAAELPPPPAPSPTVEAAPTPPPAAAPVTVANWPSEFWPPIRSEGPWSHPADSEYSQLSRFPFLAGDDDAEESPDISEPGPDLGDFPNSAFTLPRGRAYIEMAPFTLDARNRHSPTTYSWPFLLRYGVTNDVEFRLLGAGLTSEGGSDPVTGFSPLTVDMKVHLWDGKREYWIPASSLEIYLQTNWGSPAFREGTLPSINLNFDLPLSEEMNLEWTIGYSGVAESVDVVTGQYFDPQLQQNIPITRPTRLTANQFSVQWAIERELTEKLQGFIHGYYNASVPLQTGDETVLGVGFFWKQTRRLMFFGSCNAGLTDSVPPLSGQLGFAYAL